MGFEMVEADHAPELAGVAGVAYSVLTNPHYEADGCFDKLRLRKVI